jgi:hypothetical protein
MNNNKLTRVVSSQTKSPTIPVQHCSLTDYYGVAQLGTKGFIIRDFYGSGQFRVRVLTELTRGNCLANLDENSLADCLETCCRRGCCVYIFSTAKELMTWLISED